PPGAPGTAALAPETAAELRRLTAELARVLGAEEPPTRSTTPTTDPGDTATSRLATLDRELGDTLATDLAPAFDPRRHVRLDDAWAHARWDLLDITHRALRDVATAEEIAAELARLLPFAAEEPAIADTAAWLAAQLAANAPAELRDGLQALAAARHMPATAATTHSTGRAATALPIAGLRPLTSFDAAGIPVASEVEEPSRPADLPAQLALPGDPSLTATVRAELAARLHDAPDLRGEIALVTGAAPGSIGEALVAQLLRGGATVVATASALTQERRAWAMELYRRSAAPGAALHLLPANLAATADIDALVGWLASPTLVQRERPDLALSPLLPTIVAPLAAISTTGEVGDGEQPELAMRLQLTGVHRLIAQLAEHAAPGQRTTVLLPLSPNHGTFGGDGLYGETKAALEVLMQRAAAGERWGEATALIGARIGWVRGTGLMQGAALAAAAVEHHLGARTFSTAETGLLLATLLTGAARDRAQASATPLLAEATGGLRADEPLRPRLQPLIDDLTAQAQQAARTGQLRAALAPAANSERPAVDALPSPGTDHADGLDELLALAASWPAAPTAGLERLVVIAGTGELGPLGSARTRWAAEQSAEPSPGAVAELAWLCGLVRYERAGYRGRWIDEATGEPVAEAALPARYADAVAQRTGLRPLDDDPALDPAGLHQFAPLVATRETAFAVAERRDAEPFLAASAQASLRQADDGWEVVVPAGATLRLPRQIEHSRRVAGQLPRGLELTRLGAPADLAASADRMALVDLLCTVEAFTDAGLEPGELLEHLHPTQLASTQGAGLGGLASLRRLLLDQLLAEPRQSDRIQESLGNVAAAHVVQAFVGSYGTMLHPVGACATAAVSLEAGRDLILAGKALAVVTGGFDDLTAEGLTGFGDMGATASSDDLDAMGIAPGEASRPGDMRRRGFVEAQGGGAQLLLRADLAVALGVPARGVLIWAGSFADGLQRSIPAPGLGLLGAAAGGPQSPLAQALAAHGLTADDLAFVSKHDTSTEMNDPGEADLHHRIQQALGRTRGNPLAVISQKSLTGHSKGGAAAWQLDGALRALHDRMIPGNRSLESADPLLREAATLAVGRRTLHVAAQLPLRAALLSSLGFGHISALVAVAHPAALLAAIPDRAARADYARRAGERRAAGARTLLAARCGEPLTTRRPAPSAAERDRDAEARMLLASPPRWPAPGVPR
ncbi:MAG: beta-ketoacyl synthase N-terminal-like domain-containing protein, partial [Patulibacter sp.]